MLFDKFNYKSLKLRNKIVMAPMCQYSVENEDGKITNWHRTHYESRAIGGAGLIIMEATAVEEDGRISSRDLGLYSDEQIEPLKELVESCHKYGSKIGVQIAHAGRKSQCAKTPVSSCDVAFSEEYKKPRILSTKEVKEIVFKFENAIERAIKAGVDTIELHGAHGYLLHQFHSNITNNREDEYGKDKTKLCVEVIKAAKKIMPKDMPLIFRISAIEYSENGYGLNYSSKLCKVYKEAGVDIFHVSTGGDSPFVGSFGKNGAKSGYQLVYATEIKKAVNIPVIAVGKLERPELANAVVQNGYADLIAIGREFLRNPNYPLNAAKILKEEIDIPFQLNMAYK